MTDNTDTRRSSVFPDRIFELHPGTQVEDWKQTDLGGWIYKSARVGDGVIVFEGASIGEGTRVSDRGSIGARVVIGALVVIGAGVVIVARVVLGNEVRIGDRAYIGDGAYFQRSPTYIIGTKDPVFHVAPRELQIGCE